MDFANQIVQLCAAGIEAESHSCFDEARVLFLQAWEKADDAYEACIAAHYVARHSGGADALRWHQLALERAITAAESDDRVLPFFALYHANVASAHEDLRQFHLARVHYAKASRYLPVVPQGPFRVRVEFRIRRGLARCDRSILTA